MGNNPVPLFLVTGATGFVGANLVRTLLARGERVRAFGRNRAILESLVNAGAEAVEGDLRNEASVIDACRDVRTIFHVGAFSSPWGDHREFFATNARGTRNVIYGCTRHSVERIVYVSSPSVTFNGRDCIDQNEAAPYAKVHQSSYSLTKMVGEELVNAAKGTLETVILRPKAIFGPGDTSLLPRLIRAAEIGRLPQIGNGKNRVDLTYVDNVVHALLLAGTANNAIGKTYLITNGDIGMEPPCLWTVIRQVLRELDIPTQLRSVPLPAALLLAGMMEVNAKLTGSEALLTRYTAQILARTQTYDISAARHDLGYAPIVSLTEGLARTIAAFADERRRV